MNGMKKKLRLVTFVYWILLTYMLAALIWWFISLQQQNNIMTALRMGEVSKQDPQYGLKINQILLAKKRKVAQYVGEGFTFLVLIVIGAVFVFRAARKQLLISQQQQNFMMAITHELKTPISVALLNLETLQKRKLEPATEQKLIQNTIFETNRLNSLCNNILLAAQLDKGGYKKEQTQVDFSAIVLKCVQEFQTRFPKRMIEHNLADNTLIMGEELLLTMLVNNLLENAIKYSPKDTIIEVVVDCTLQQINFQVADNGAGIPDVAKKQVFEKFYRMGDENTRNTKGTGLGLYLCKKIVEQHSGTIHVADNKPQGCVFMVQIKRANA